MKEQVANGLKPSDFRPNLTKAAKRLNIPISTFFEAYQQLLAEGRVEVTMKIKRKELVEHTETETLKAEPKKKPSWQDKTY